MNLTDQELEFQVLVEGRVVSKHGNRSMAEASIAYLDESTKQKATIVPVTKGGQQFLLG